MQDIFRSKQEDEVDKHNRLNCRVPKFKSGCVHSLLNDVLIMNHNQVIAHIKNAMLAAVSHKILHMYRRHLRKAKKDKLMR